MSERKSKIKFGGMVEEKRVGVDAAIWEMSARMHEAERREEEKRERSKNRTEWAEWFVPDDEDLEEFEREEEGGW